MACSSLALASAPVPMPSFRHRAVPARTLPSALIAAACALLSAAGCQVTALDAASTVDVINQCSGDTDCGTGVCKSGRCMAKQGYFSTMLVEISPPVSGDPLFAGVDYLQRLDGLDLEGDHRVIELARPAQITGTVSFEPYAVGADGESCALEFLAEDPSLSMLASAEGIPVAVSFIPSDRLLGIASTKYSAEVDTSAYEAATPFQAPPLSFGVEVPPGDYDIYVQPRAAAEGGCDIPPTLLRRFDVKANDLLLGLDLPPPASFALVVKWPLTGQQPSLEGWKVDMLDPVTGRVISTQGTLVHEPSLSGYYTRVSYSPVTLDEDESELVRLAPPEGVDAPTVILARSVLELFSPGSGVIDQFVGYPEPVQIQGQITVAGEAEPTTGTVTVVSSSLEGVGEGVFASYVRSVEAGEDGTFELSLLPGKYQVYATPSGGSEPSSSGVPVRTSAASQTEWVIGASPTVQAGKTIELLPPAHVTGTANLPGGAPASGATVVAVASPKENQVDLLTQAAQGDLAFAPAAQSAIVAGDGTFDVQADPGVYAVSVRPPEGSGFAWYVASQFRVQPAASSELLVQRLGTPNVPLPVSYTGRVVVPIDQETSVPIADALLRAYVYLDAEGNYSGDPTKAVSVVQIGETRADGDGNFELLIPANLN
jgi:hypothetical protein